MLCIGQLIEAFLPSGRAVVVVGLTAVPCGSHRGALCVGELDVNFAHVPPPGETVSIARSAYGLDAARARGALAVISDRNRIGEKTHIFP